MSDLRLTREGLCRTFQLTPETLAEFERAGILRPGEDNLFDLAQTAGALFGFGMSRAASAERKVGAVALAIQEVMPALQRLASLPERAALDGEARQRVTDELSAFFNAFAGLMTRAKDALEQED